MSKSGQIGAMGHALADAINREPTAERTSQASYCAHEGKLYVEQNQNPAARAETYRKNAALREHIRGQNSDRMPTGFREQIGEVHYILNIPEHDEKMLKRLHPEARDDAPGDIRARFWRQQAILHPEWVIG